MISTSDDLRSKLARLGVRRMLLAIHDTSFPSDPDEDIGRGTPATRASARLFAYAQRLGFTGIQLGPQGQTSRFNPSPYDGTIFSRHLGNVAVASLRSRGAFAGLVDERSIDRLLIGTGGPARHHHAYDASQALLDEAYRALLRGARPDLRERLAAFRRGHASWLEADALYSALSQAHGGAGFREWRACDRDLWRNDDRARRVELASLYGSAIERYAFGQLLVHEELARVRAEVASHSSEARAVLQLYGDLQVGYADPDMWRYSGAFLQGYCMGAPPSRTNPAGQPWGYPVLDPSQYGGAARALMIARADKALTEYDSLRIDHPHGLVCPWVYRSDAADPGRAVREGARLFESPDLADHPELASFAIARPDQIDRQSPRHADRWVRDLEEAQVDRYAVFIEAIVEAARRHGRCSADLSCEVLSTMPTPLARVIARYGLGRWRVTQKAQLDEPSDVYRTENAQREDWVMLGNHDTAPIFSVVRGWSPAERDRWARHLKTRLRLTSPERLANDGYLATAMLAELFVCRAENVSIFFGDLFGYEERFNVPGLVDDANWTLRLPSDFEQMHANRLGRGHALDLPLAVDLALAAREGEAYGSGTTKRARVRIAAGDA